MFHTRRDSLNKLEAIAQNILRSNLKTLQENNNLRKHLLLCNLFSNIERKQNIRLRNSFGNLIREPHNPYAYAHFANFINQFYKRKLTELNNQGFNAILSNASQEQDKGRNALALLNKLNFLLAKARKRAFKDMIKSLYSEKIRDMMLEKMVNNF